MTTKSSRVLLVPLWAGLLLLGSPALSIAALYVDVQGDRLSVRAEEVPLQELLNEIALQSELKVVQQIALDRPVSLAVENRTLPEVLDRLFADNSYQLYQAQPRNDLSNGPDTDTLWIFSDGSSIDHSAIVFYETLLLHGNVQERKEALKVLRKLGTTDAVNAISLALGDTNVGIRDLAFDALASIGGDDALAAIASASQDDDAWVRGESASALAGNDSESAVGYLTIALSDPDPNVRMFVVDALADFPGERSLVALGRALHDENPSVRLQAVDALEHIGSDFALRVLRHAQDDEDPAVRDAISDALSVSSSGY